jgi:hypothetical protein
VSDFGQVLQIGTTRNNYTWIWDQIYSEMEMDGVTLLLELISVSTGLHCVPIVYSNVTPRHNDYHHSWGVSWVRWNGGALATDGVIYCIPYCSTQVLAIDPFKEISMTLQNNFRQHPQELGRLFVKGEGDETFYDSAVRKFGMILRKFLNSLKNVPPWMKNGMILLIATPFHSLWLQLYVRIVQRL